MNHELKLSVSIDINCSASRLWQVMTDPKLIKQYLYGAECITDWQVDSPIIFQGSYEGHTYKDKGIVQERIENQLLRYRYWTGFSGLPDAPENYGLVSYILKVLAESQTRLTWEQIGYPDESRLMHAEENMPAFMASIKAVAEK